jgi:multiple sugar transport system permease protein
VLVIIVAISAGLFTAMLFNRPFRFRGIARALLMLPWAFPDVPVAMIFIWILNAQFGVVNIPVRFFLPWMTTNPQWLDIPETALAWMVLITSW